MTCIFIWRLLIDLQQACLKDVKLDSHDNFLSSHTVVSNLTSLNFNRAMGMDAMGSVVMPNEIEDYSEGGKWEGIMDLALDSSCA